MELPSHTLSLDGRTSHLPSPHRPRQGSCLCHPICPAACPTPTGRHRGCATLAAVAHIHLGGGSALQPALGWGFCWVLEGSLCVWSLSCLCFALSPLSLNTAVARALCHVTLRVKLPTSLLVVNVFLLVFSSRASERGPSRATTSASLQQHLLGIGWWSLGWGIANEVGRDGLPTLESWCELVSPSLWFTGFPCVLRSQNSHGSRHRDLCRVGDKDHYERTENLPEVRQKSPVCPAASLQFGDGLGCYCLLLQVFNSSTLTDTRNGSEG